VEQQGREIPVRPVITYSFSVALSSTNNVVAQFHVPIDEPVHQLNSYLDKVTDSIFRQKIKHDIEALKKALDGASMEVEANTRFLDEAANMYNKIDKQQREEHSLSKKQGTFSPKQLTGRAAAERNQAAINVKMSTEKRESAFRLIKSLTQQVELLEGQLKSGVDESAISYSGNSNRKRP
jgi:hypothetical protein